MTDLIREVDEDMRREQLARLWSNFGSYIIGGSVAIVAATAAIVLWQNHHRATHEASTEALVSAYALLDQGQAAKAADAFKEIGAKDTGTAATLAGFGEGQALSQQDRWQDAQAAYTQAATRASSDDLRDWAKILASYSASQAGTPGNAPDVSAEAEKGRPFAMTAAELEALRHLARGETKEAAASLKSIVENVQAPASLRERAKTLLAAVEPGYTPGVSDDQPAGK